MTRRWTGIGRYDVLILVSGIWFFAKFLRYAFPPLFDELKLAFDVSNTEVGAAFTGFMLVYAVMQFPSGLFADRLGSKRVIAAGVLVAAGGAGVVVLGGPFVLLIVAMLVMGAGTGAHKTVAIKYLSVVYPTRTGRTLGVFDTLGTFGGVVAPIVVAAVVGFGLGWRTLFLGATLAGFALAVSFLVRVPRTDPDDGDGTNDSSLPLRAYVAPFRDRRFFTFVLVTLGFGFAYNGLVAFLPLYLVQEVGLTTTTASVLYSALFVVSFVQIVTGELADRAGSLTVIGGTLALATASLVVLLFAPMGGVELLGIPLVAILAVVGIGLGSHGFRPVRGLHLTALLPDSLAGGGLGAVRTGLMGAGAIAPAIVGLVADVAGFQSAFVFVLATLATATGLAFLLLATESTCANHRR